MLTLICLARVWLRVTEATTLTMLTLICLAMVVVLSIHVEYVLLLYKEWGPCLGSPRGYNVSPQ
jgi:hypothetical protein